MNKKMPALLVTGLMLVATIAGCGADPAGAGKARQLQNRRAPNQRAVPNPMQPRMLPGQVPGQMGQPGGDVRQLLAAVGQAQAQVKGFSATVDTFDKGAGGTGTQTLKVAFKKPSTLKIDVVKDSGGGEGSQALWTGGGNLDVKPKFPPMKVSLSVSDKRLVSKNGWTIKETEVNATLKVLLDPASQVKVIGQQPMNGKMLTMVEVRSQQSPKGATHEVIGIDPQVNLPTFRSIYKGQQLIYKLEIKSMSLNPPSGSALNIS